ncbi:hypothetical protein [Bacillus sp. REN16]|uniref:hypothetical protein n=1 Tax=Bacillus sp. REN16 TaxID=2887296 RepID=UPI001E3C40D9|nr:hypothetical protein [Bacillus sp. REN16]MCC3359417.1 hypothetical protein [Bacillus sp. REN16]
MKISREFHPYRTAFKGERKLAKDELQKSEKADIWEKQKFNASIVYSDIKSHDGFERAVMEYNVFPMIFANLEDIKEETLFPCQIFDGNEAWIGRDSVGKYRYFTGEPFSEAIGYTVFDLLLCFQEVKGKGYTQQLQFVRKELINLLNVSFDDVNWEKKESEKYVENKCIISLFKSQDFQMNYPKLFKKVKAYVDVLEEILDHGQRFIDSTRKDSNDNSYFVMYANQAKVSATRYRNAVTRLKELGLLISEQRKVPFYDKESRTSYMTTATCFSVPLYSEKFFREVEEVLNSKVSKA